MEDKVNAIMMIEILGKPAKHVKKILVEIVDKLSKEDKVSIINKKVVDPKPIKGHEDLFTSFAEIEVETDLSKLMLLIFAYMPSHLEIMEPEELRLKNSDLNIFLNELSKKLHQYDELARALMIERQNIAKQIQEGKIKLKAPKKAKKSVKKKKGKKKKSKS